MSDEIDKALTKTQKFLKRVELIIRCIKAAWKAIKEEYEIWKYEMTFDEN